ncbi:MULTISPECIES: NAD(P)/FAD-dependent oxidoreductase [Pseudomonas]|uniref:NAD(P)/FAD-dependent oxidoreductase n=1 Tax=Pseudomonas guariconensis TaxID=1288410 RepID=A0AAX0VRW8_9PSED|nr:MULTISPECIES: NAD(P)/FAD-dependent oxidoreductase [Pseudomonas]MCO7624159.1 NAD(P)/FAD-dependent oxidoreductase [Pseudomonas guariconensis]MDM9593776.1 NAD(P)/FAD-dependent oxidoreductase [Pseudomonas guariconensis]MDM9606603.1 NAD(P)/FAD-dependent oxidoreductase [Pseudomonas guariconensis]MDM9611559.1 NAD(P)/FAD-dependent oxidoreductase [Pseudomonas guariconensis]MEB3842190.1 NAD(P)/FAD-dependent oxidoreductase [Pseudomonas guariconensis]
MNPHILIIGAGFAGVWSALSAARLLDQAQRGDVSISVLAPQAELRIRPRFYESDVHSMKAPLGALFETVGVTFIKGHAQTIDVEGRTVGYTDADGQPRQIGYDRLVLAAGSQVARPPVPGLAEHTFDVDQMESAMRLEQHLVGLTKQPASPARDTVVVCGGGFTGIETATEMPTRLRTILGEDAPVRVVVVDRGPSIGAALGAGITPSIVEACEQAGVQWLTGRSVVAVDAGGVTLDDGEYIASKTVIWTVGVKASPLTAQVPGERDGFGRLRVDDHLKVIGQEHIYATGDVAWAAVDESGNHALMTCQHAIPMGRHCGNNAAADLLGVAPVVYRQPVYVTCLDLGGWGATFSEGWERTLKYKGQEGKDLKRQINTVWIYPPAADRAVALAAADPLIPVV